MSLFKDFRDFALRGNVFDLAVGIIIGAAFGKIVSSLVANILMPPLGLLIGGVDFKQLKLVLKAASGDTPAVVMEYGIFLQSVFDFIIIAFAIFIAINLLNKFYNKKEVEKEPPMLSNEEALLTDIRDLLKNQNRVAQKTLDIN